MKAKAIGAVVAGAVMLTGLTAIPASADTDSGWRGDSKGWEWRNTLKTNDGDPGGVSMIERQRNRSEDDGLYASFRAKGEHLDMESGNNIQCAFLKVEGYSTRKRCIGPDAGISYNWSFPEGLHARLDLRVYSPFGDPITWSYMTHGRS